MNRHITFLFYFILTVALIQPVSWAQKADEIGVLYENLEWRSVGPALMGGRTVDIDVAAKTPWILYAAMGPSGVWKSSDNGITWEPVFDKENTVSVGDVTVSLSHPEIVWVGTGEATCRNSVTIGDGVYKSEDGGKTWKHMGLKETRHISRIVINPGDPHIVYVAAMGHLWGSNEERGVYKTGDGGKSWEKVLYIDENTGIADLAADPSNSLILYAAAYDHRRLPYHYRSGGPGSGIYKTIDGGKSWKKLSQDLPEGILGRIGLAVAPSNPDVVYALIEHEEGGIWRSEDKGKTWKRTCSKSTYDQVNNRPFYYSQIRVDPTDDKVIYVFSGGTYVSKNMGEKFKLISRGTHPDHHALWIDPANSLHLIDGNDGGIDISYDGGAHWRPVRSIAAAEVYQVGFDRQKPYHVFCGLQDNGSWGAPSATCDTAGIGNCDWYSIGGGDGFYVQVDPQDSHFVYRNFQGNNLSRFDRRIGLAKSIRPEASLSESPYRCNWNSPVHISPHDPKIVYTGGNFLFKTTDMGYSWEKISPDLTTNDPSKQIDSGGPITRDNTSAEFHCTIFTISESPVKQGVVWCGTDDGNVQVTQDGGKTWENVVGNIKGLPKNTWCSRIEASFFETGTAYASFDGHRHDDYGTYLYKTKDFGKTWTSLKGNLPFGWIHVIREDPKNKNLLYVGTEFGIFASLDSGNSWFSLKNNLPTVAIRDIAVHPKENDLIIGTHGRGVWILDDLAPLQEMSPNVLASNEHLFSIRPSVRRFFSTRGEGYAPPEFSGANSPNGLIITTYFKEKPETRPEIRILDKEGQVVSKVRHVFKKGLHRMVWNFQKIPRTSDGEEITGSSLLDSALSAEPGNYSVSLHVGDKKYESKGVVLPDPRISIDPKEMELLKEAQLHAMMLSRKTGLAITAARKIRRELDKLKAKKDLPNEVLQSLEEVNKKFIPLEEELVPKKALLGSDYTSALRGVLGSKPSQMAVILTMNLIEYPGKPTETEKLMLSEVGKIVDDLSNKLNILIQENLPKLNVILEDNGMKPIGVPEPIK
ncbi:MAG: hypothetical protein JXB26_05340 [Candidatus Aminicenantes bacterium]|nr:hypothetical protein [Candidatus Aminicenantes bacterium]